MNNLSFKAFLPTLVLVAIFALLAAFNCVKIITTPAPRNVHFSQQTLGELFAPRLKQSKPEAIGIILGAFVIRSVLAAIYLLPATVAGFRGHTQYAGILAVNFFLGWTVLGWIAAVLWAVWQGHRTVSPPMT